jgi:hypothetical protein
MDRSAFAGASSLTCGDRDEHAHGINGDDIAKKHSATCFSPYHSIV